MAFILAISGLLFGWMATRRWLEESDPFLCLGLAPMLGSVALIGGANWLSRSQMGVWAGLLVAVSLLLLWRRPAPELKTPELSTLHKILLTLSLVAVAGYTLYSQASLLDTDNWIHEPLIATYMRGVFPPVHPFFPEVEMNGHYGRDLLMATLTPDLGDPFTTVRWVNFFLQVGGFLALFGLLGRFGANPAASLGGAVLAFFGICVGFRVGLVDSFDGNNGVVYALLIGLFYLMLRVLEDSEWPVWLLAGLYLGTYQLVYETHFGLMLLTGFCLALLFVREKRKWIGILVVLALAMGLACTEGGPFTDLARRAGHQQADESQQNVAQHVSVTFPKSEFMKVLVTTADYQRLSVAYKSGPFRSWSPSISGEGYMNVFDPRFLYAHWLPLYLAPVSLWALWRRQSRVGLAFWIFGCWSYFIPALVDFGPIYEWEYFRWEFAAGFGWAVALGVAIGEECFSLSDSPLGSERLESGAWQLTLAPDWWRPLVGVILLGASLAAGEKLLNDAIIDKQKTSVPLFVTSSWWRVHRPELGVTKADISAMRWLAERLQKGDRILSNLGDETPLGLWPDSVLATRTGGHPAGHARPPRDRRVHAHPNFYRNGMAKAFYETGRVDLLEDQVEWLYLDLERQPAPQGLDGSPVFEDSEGHRRQVFKVLAQQRPEADGRLGTFTLRADAAELRPGSLYRLQGEVEETVGWVTTRLVDAQGQSVTEPIRAWLEPGQDLFVYTPLEEGDYTLEIAAGDEVRRQSLTTNYFKRLTNLTTRLDLPDGLEPKRFARLTLGLTSPVSLRSNSPTSVLVRWKRVDGDYVWEIDSIAQPITLELEAGKESVYDLEVLSPWETGGYLVELSLRDEATGRVTPLGQMFGPIPVGSNS